MNHDWRKCEIYELATLFSDEGRESLRSVGIDVCICKNCKAISAKGSNQPIDSVYHISCATCDDFIMKEILQ